MIKINNNNQLQKQLTDRTTCAIPMTMPIWRNTANAPDWTVADSPLVKYATEAVLRGLAAKRVNGSWDVKFPNYYPGLALAVSDYQRAAGLTVDGDLGPNTCRSLREANAWPKLDDGFARAAMAQALSLYNRAVIAYVVTQDEDLGEACRKFGRWVAAVRRKARKPAPGVQPVKRIGPPSSQQVAWPVGSPRGSLRTSNASTIGFVPLLAIPLVAGEAAVAAEIVTAVGYVASAAAAAWAAVKIGDALNTTLTTSSTPETVTVDVEAKVEDQAPTIPAGEGPPNFKFEDVDWRKLVKVAIAIAAALGAVLVAGLGVVASLLPVAGAAVAVGLEIVIAAGGLLLLFLLRKGKKRG
jgi:peptidoglycan hydrolase-like protein with peptidoglycan-binding domain